MNRKVTIDAGTKANWNLLRNSFKAWRDDAMVSKIERQIDRRLVAETFSYWMVRQRGRLLERVRNHRFLREALETWNERLDGIRDELDTACEIFENTQVVKVLRSSLEIWRDHLAFRNGETEIALVNLNRGLQLLIVQACHEACLFRKSVKIWRNAIETQKRRKTEAEHARYYFLVRRSLMRWHARSIQMRKLKRQNLLNEIRKVKNSTLVSRCLQLWREKNAQHLDRIELADAVRRERDVDLLHEGFWHWRERSNTVRTLEFKAADHSRTRLLRYMFRLAGDCLMFVGRVSISGVWISAVWTSSRKCGQIMSLSAHRTLYHSIFGSGDCAFSNSEALPCRRTSSANDLVVSNCD